MKNLRDLIIMVFAIWAACLITVLMVKESSGACDYKMSWNYIQRAWVGDTQYDLWDKDNNGSIDTVFKTENNKCIEVSLKDFEKAIQPKPIKWGEHE